MDVLAIARDLGIEVLHRPDLGPDVSGRIERTSRGWRITINSLHHRRRRRFTLAHEIAHYVLHRDLIGPGGYVEDNALYRSSLSDHFERQANRLAADILIPIGLIQHLLRQGVQEPSRLAAAFDVSREAMEIRLRELRLDQGELPF